MYSAVPPQPDSAPKPDEAWGVRRGVRLDFPGPAALAGNARHSELLRTYLTDLLRPYGLALDAGKLAAGGQSYGEMAEALVRLAVPAHDSADLLVLASAVPDITPGRSTAIYLSHLCPGNPLAFALSDQGPAAAFTALRLISEYASTDGLRRALLVVVEQAALPYDTGEAPMPAVNSGVALLLGDGLDDAGDDDTQPAPLAARGRQVRLDSVHVLTGTPAPEVALADALDVIAPDAAVIIGNGLAPYTGALTERSQARIVTTRPERPTTGVWWECVGELQSASETPRLVLADHDAESASLCLATFCTSGP